MMRYLLTCLAFVGATSVTYAAGKFPKPMSYAKPVGTDLVFVQLGDMKEEQDNATTAQKQKFAELRAKYAKPGLYKTTEPVELVWELTTPAYTPYDNAFLSPDGQHLICVEGDFWQTEPFPGGTRPTADKIGKQMASPALSFHVNGKLVKRYLMSDFVDDVEVLKHTPEHLLWYASAAYNAETGRFVMYTQEATKRVFDVNTGDVIEKSQVGLSNPIVEKILIVMAGMTALILAGWGLFAYKRRQPDAERLANSPSTN
jgi:hypothetical protein